MNTNFDLTLKTFKKWISSKPVDFAFGNPLDPFGCPIVIYLRDRYSENAVFYVNTDKIVVYDAPIDELDGLTARQTDDWYEKHSFWSPLSTWHTKLINLVSEIDKKELFKSDLTPIMRKIR